jgi:alkylated DNA repair protein alkB family protein 8
MGWPWADHWTMVLNGLGQIFRPLSIKDQPLEPMKKMFQVDMTIGLWTAQLTLLTQVNVIVFFIEHIGEDTSPLYDRRKLQSFIPRMVQPRFVRPTQSSPSSISGEPNSSNLYVANCGPAVGLTHNAIAAVFAEFGEVNGVYAADDSGVRVIVSFADPFSAKAALEALSGRPCPDLKGRSLHIRYSVLQLPSETQVNDCVPVSLIDSELNIPGLFLLPDFVTVAEEQQLLAAVDARHWIGLAKRRVQHYGYEFCYGTRNVDTKKRLGELPSFVSPILERIYLFPNFDNGSASLNLDQLTVNEYPSGVGLSPHIDTHSAFEDCIFSLSLAGPCIMEFRRYSVSTWKASTTDAEKSGDSSCIKKALYLPPRSMLLLSGEARYAWNHYIPHHKVGILHFNLSFALARITPTAFSSNCLTLYCTLID